MPALLSELGRERALLLRLAVMTDVTVTSGGFFKAIRPQAARHVVPGDCFITRSISKELMPESSFTASNAQVSHQTWKVSQRKYSHTFNSSLPVSFYRKCSLEFKDY